MAEALRDFVLWEQGGRRLPLLSVSLPSPLHPSSSCLALSSGTQPPLKGMPPPVLVRKPVVQLERCWFLEVLLDVFVCSSWRLSVGTVAAWDASSLQLHLTYISIFVIFLQLFSQHSYERSTYLTPSMVEKAKENIPVCLYWNWYGLWLLCFLAGFFLLLFFFIILNSWAEGNKTLKGRVLSLLLQCKGRTVTDWGIALSCFRGMPSILNK